MRERKGSDGPPPEEQPVKSAGSPASENAQDSGANVPKKPIVIDEQAESKGADEKESKPKGGITGRISAMLTGDPEPPPRIVHSRRLPVALALSAIGLLLGWLLIWLIGDFSVMSLLAGGLTLLGGVWYTFMRRRSLTDGVVFYSHNQILYYWPIWLGAFVISDLTEMFGQESTVTIGGGAQDTTMLCSPSMGLFFLIIVGLVVFFTSVNIRGVWAVVLGIGVIAVGLLFSVFDLWPGILSFLGGLTLYVNRDFYVAMGVVVFVPWFVVVFMFDMRRYFHFMPTQIKMVNEIGEGEKNFDSMGVVMEKQRDNFVQHMALGFGSGDLIITTSGGQRDIIIFPNVLRIDQVLNEIQEIRERRGRE